MQPSLWIEEQKLEIGGRALYFCRWFWLAHSFHISSLSKILRCSCLKSSRDLYDLPRFVLVTVFLHSSTYSTPYTLRATVLLALREGLSKEQRIVVPPTAFESNTQSATEHHHIKTSTHRREGRFQSVPFTTRLC